MQRWLDDVTGMERPARDREKGRTAPVLNLTPVPKTRVAVTAVGVAEETLNQQKLK